RRGPSTLSSTTSTIHSQGGIRMPDRVMISMPFRYRNPGDLLLLETAVSSVMRQTYENIILILVVDGDPLVMSARDLGGHDVITYHVPEGRGRYFADAVTLEVAMRLGVPMWMVHDSDDWTDETHVERLVSKMKSDTDVVFGGYVRRSLEEHRHSYDARR